VAQFDMPLEMVQGSVEAGMRAKIALLKARVFIRANCTVAMIHASPAGTVMITIAHSATMV